MALSTSNITSGFIDLATFDEIEKYMYGGADATAYFVRETRKSTWFTQIPVVLSRASGQAGFGQEWSVSISRAGDYLLQTWLQLKLGALSSSQTNPADGFATKYLAWTKNLMHNLLEECSITFNDLVAARFDSYHLDFWAAFTVPAGKRDGYNQMIGNTPDLVDPSTSKPEKYLFLPLPFFYTRDSGVALPTAALPYNDMRINLSFRDWTSLLTTYTRASAVVGGQYLYTTNASVLGDLLNSTAPTMSNVNVWANYAIVSNDERKRMACAPRDILIEQVQTAPRQTFNQGLSNNYDIRFSHAIKVLFFGVRNIQYPTKWSNYTAITLPILYPLNPTQTQTLTYAATTEVDPIKQTSLIYENTNRLGKMGSDYYSLVNPYYDAPVIPSETGYHLYSYSLDFISLDPMGSTNYGKLTNVSIAPESIDNLLTINSSYVGQFILTAVNNNIIRISGGALGFPVL
jgi:hypothetical protein